MATRIPPLLQPYLALPAPSSLLLLTSVLGASTNWLLLRLLSSHLTPTTSLDPSSTPQSEDVDTNVLLVSFLRDEAFFKDGARRLGLDLGRLATKGRYGFVDGLSGLCTPAGKGADAKTGVEGAPVVLRGVGVKDVKEGIVEGLRKLGADRKTVLVIDGLDFLLAAQGGEEGLVVVEDMVMELREVRLQFIPRLMLACSPCTRTGIGSVVGFARGLT